MKKRFHDAAALCAAHVERFPDSSGAQALFARIHQQAGDLAVASAAYEKAIEHDPKNAAAKRALEEGSSSKRIFP